MSRPDRPAVAPDRDRGRPAMVSLGTKLVLLGSLVTLAAIASAFALLSVQVRRQSRSHLADLLVQNQETVLELQKQNLGELLRTSRLMTRSPTLRAAMETYASEASGKSAGRSDLVATVQAELDKIRGLLGKDLTVITDAKGTVLAASPMPLGTDRWDMAFSSHPCVRRALRPDATTEESNIAVLQLDGEHYQIGCVPIVLQEFVIGTLTVGERIDRRFLSDLRSALRSEVAVTWGDVVLSSTLAGLAPGGPPPAAPAALDAAAGAAPGVVTIGEEDYVLAPLALGSDADGRPATLILLRSLSQIRASAGRSLLLALLACGAFAMLLGSLAAWRLSRSLEEQRRQILLHAREDLVRVERLKESEKLASLGRMLSGAAHEINNPLTGVVGNLEILLGSAQIEESTRQRLERVHNDAARIVGLVRNLLQVAHRDTGHRDLIEVNQLIRETAALRQHDFKVARLELRLDLATVPLRLQASGLELQQVFLNIINNAYDALKEGAREPVLIVRTALEHHARIEHGPQVVVVFEDGGPGMSDPKKVFDPFYTTKDVGKGTGLGLSISHAIVQNHGGQITAENRPEGGARFTIRLPADAGAASRTLAPRSGREARSGAPRLAISVLVLEDEPTNLDLQQSILGSLGAAVVGARSGAEAIAWLERRSFDLIVSDLRMPGPISGLEFYRWIETHRPESAKRVLLVTGDSASDSTRAFLKDTGRPCLLKPFSVQEYVTAIQETLDALQPAA